MRNIKVAVVMNVKPKLLDRVRNKIRFKPYRLVGPWRAPPSISRYPAVWVRNLSASSAAMQPLPAEVIAWR